MDTGLHGAEVWVTERADLVVTIPLDERDHQKETDLRGRLFRAVQHRFGATGNRDMLRAYGLITMTGTLQIIEDPVMHPTPQYGVMLVQNGVPA